jgi:hypothetical protein
MKYEAQKKTAVVQKVIRRLNLVAWSGIEPVTRGFTVIPNFLSKNDE